MVEDLESNDSKIPSRVFELTSENTNAWKCLFPKYCCIEIFSKYRPTHMHICA